MKKLLAAAAVGLTAIGLAACGEDRTQNAGAHQSQYAESETNRAGFKPFIPKNGVEFSNYNKAQELYDSPSTIIWCTSAFPIPNSPLFTVPIAGKLTSSSVSFFPNKVERFYASDDNGAYYPELTSVDGMYHGSPPPYRYGFTPGGQYAEFNNAMPTFCTTALNSFQRKSTQISLTVDQAALKGQKKAEAALEAGQKVEPNGATKTAPASKAAAQKALEEAVGG
jgi:hypothetical protein